MKIRVVKLDWVLMDNTMQTGYTGNVGNYFNDGRDHPHHITEEETETKHRKLKDEAIAHGDCVSIHSYFTNY